MLDVEGKYGNVNIDGMTVDIDKMDNSEFDKYLEKLEAKRLQLITQQNDCLTKIIDQ